MMSTTTTPPSPSTTVETTATAEETTTTPSSPRPTSPTHYQYLPPPPPPPNALFDAIRDCRWNDAQSLLESFYYHHHHNYHTNNNNTLPCASCHDHHHHHLSILTSYRGHGWYCNNWTPLHWACCNNNRTPPHIIHRLLSINPVMVHVTDRCGYTPLHYALRFLSPSSKTRDYEEEDGDGSSEGVILALIDAAISSSSNIPSYWMSSPSSSSSSSSPTVVGIANMRDSRGCTPLHRAMIHNWGVMVVKRLLSSETMTTTTTTTTATTRPTGDVDDDDDKINRRRPMILSRTENGRRPSDFFFRRWNRGLGGVLKFIVAASVEEGSNDDERMGRGRDGKEDRGMMVTVKRSVGELVVKEEKGKRTMRLIDLYEMTIVLLEAIHHATSSSSSSSFHPLHTAIIAPDCPWNFCEMILRLHHPPTILHQVDDGNNGHYPLSLALSLTTPMDHDGGLYRCDKCDSPLSAMRRSDCGWYQRHEETSRRGDILQRYCRGCLEGGALNGNGVYLEDYSIIYPVNKIKKGISTMLHLYPPAAAIPDNNGRLPLFTAIENHNLDVTILELFIRGAPDSLGVADSGTNLFPFMLAAAVATTVGGRDQQCEERSTIDKNDDDDCPMTATREEEIDDKREDVLLQRLTMVYILLQKEPGLVILGLPSSSSSLASSQQVG